MVKYALIVAVIILIILAVALWYMHRVAQNSPSIVHPNDRIEQNNPPVGHE
jgi:hypothetical protein